MRTAIHNYFDNLPSGSREIAYEIRDMIISLAPGIEETIKYKIPFYSHFGPLCYINYSKNRLYLGLVNGAEIWDETGILQGTDRKQIRLIELHSEPNLPLAEIRSLLYQAMEINRLNSRSRGK